MLATFLCFFALHTTLIEIGGQSVTVEIAQDEASRNKGLKGRRNLLEGHGMLFVFQKPHILTFWMEDTEIPLSIAFFDSEKTLINTNNMYPPQPDAEEIPHYQSRQAALYALEMPLNWFQNHHILPGMKFSFQDQRP